MSTHVSHDLLAGWSPTQILADGCRRCNEESRHPAAVIGCMTADEFGKAWARAVAWNAGQLDDLSMTEVRVLDVLVAFAIQMERLGVKFGDLPSGDHPMPGLVSA